MMAFFGSRRILLGLMFLFAVSAHVDTHLHDHDNTESNLLEDDSSDVYVVKPAEGKGLGVFAIRDLPRGTKIIIEEPLFQITLPEIVPGKGFPVDEMMESITSSFHNLDQEQQEEYLGLHEHRFSTETDPHLPIFRSNSYNTGSDEVGLFPKIARINHSCKPNAGNWWSVKKDERVIYAARDIEEGEEITTSYIPLLMSTKERRERLTQYGFVCGCEACLESGDGKSDRRRRKIGELLGMLEAELYPKERTEKGMKRLAGKCLSLIELVEVEGLTDYLARSYHLAAVFTPDAEFWAEKELALYKLAEEDSDEALSTAGFLSRLSS